MSEGDVALACTSLLVDELGRGGVTHACLSPGSRSTAIALALARHPGMRVHVHLDERASAFFALGLAKATGRPVAVACTSGTAAANFFPAVVEAHMARVPLILLTADRPPELRGVGANQTIDQIELYGIYVRWFADAEVAREDHTASFWRELARSAIAASMGVPPGPVHLNLPFREPLTPSGEAVVLSPGGGHVSMQRTRDPQPVTDEDIAALAAMLQEAERGAIVAGSLRQHAGSVVELAARLGWPLLAEATSGLRSPGWALAAGQQLLANAAFASAHVPDIVMQVGAAPTTRAAQAFIASSERLVIVDPDRLVADPAHHPSWTLQVDPESLAQSLLDRLEERLGWHEDWASANAVARRAINGLLDGWDEPFEGRVARDLAAMIPNGGTLVVGSSMPVRDLDLFMAPRDGLRVLANRGASGIDGFVSTVLGVAASGAPTYALLGDLTLLHDAGSLLWSGTRGLDAVLVVLNNDGGAIFSFLPGQRELPEHEEFFITSHGLDLAKLSNTAGAGHERIEHATDLVPAVERATSAGGVQIVEVPSNRERNLALHAEVSATVVKALEGLSSRGTANG